MAPADSKACPSIWTGLVLNHVCAPVLASLFALGGGGFVFRVGLRWGCHQAFFVELDPVSKLVQRVIAPDVPPQFSPSPRKRVVGRATTMQSPNSPDLR